MFDIFIYLYLYLSALKPRKKTYRIGLNIREINEYT